MRSIPGGLDLLAWAAAASSALAFGALPLGCREALIDPIPAAHADDAAPRRGGTLRLASFSNIRNLDPAGPSDGLSAQPQHLIFAGLIDWDDGGHIVPDLAERWEEDDGGRAYRFTLRQGVMMHDGQEFTADDVKRSAERALAPTTPNPNASYFTNIVGFESFVAGQADRLDGVTVDGRYMVTFHLRDPDATFLPLLAMNTLRPVCQSGGARYSDTWAPCGAGPFKLAPGGWQRGTSLRIIRNEAYFRPGLPYLDAVEWSFGMQALAQRFRFEAGELDLLRDLTAGDEARFAADPRWRPLGKADGDTRVYGESMNTRMPPFDNVEIRRAVAAAIDREHYRLLRPATMTILRQVVPPGVPGYDPSVTGQADDPRAALDHMRKAGYAYDPHTGAGGWPKPIEYPLYDRGLIVSTAQLLQQDLARIGLRIELRLVSWPAFLALQQRPLGAAISQGNWGMDYPDPSSFFEPLFTTASIGPESAYNTSFYSNPRVDDLVARAHREGNPERRRGLYHDADTILCDEAPWAFAYAIHYWHLHQPYVRGFTPHPIWSVDATRIWLDRAEAALGRVIGSAGLSP